MTEVIPSDKVGAAGRRIGQNPAILPSIASGRFSGQRLTTTSAAWRNQTLSVGPARPGAP